VTSFRRRALTATLLLGAWVGGTFAAGLADGGDAATAQGAGIVIGKAHAGYTPSLKGSKPIVILAIGSGARPEDNVERSLADSLHLIYLNPAKKTATLVGIPRDSYVSIPGVGTGKINSSMFYGGPQKLIETIETDFGAQIDYWALTTFWGLTDMIDDVGGLRIDVPFPMSDPYSRSDFEPGMQWMTGIQVLAFSRDRHSLSQGDFARQENGGRVMLAALEQFQKQYREDPSTMFAYIGAGSRNIDTDIPMSELVSLFYTAGKVPPARVTNVVFPGTAGMQGSLSVVFLDQERAQAMLADLEKDGILSKANTPPSPTANET
jgi:LCP family protein required for cell wall assembly